MPERRDKDSSQRTAQMHQQSDEGLRMASCSHQDLDAETKDRCSVSDKHKQHNLNILLIAGTKECGTK